MHKHMYTYIRLCLCVCVCVCLVLMCIWGTHGASLLRDCAHALRHSALPKIGKLERTSHLLQSQRGRYASPWRGITDGQIVSRLGDRLLGVKFN